MVKYKITVGSKGKRHVGDITFKSKKRAKDYIKKLRKTRVTPRYKNPRIIKL